MRSFVFLLVLGNLLVFAWTQGYLGSAASPDARRVAQQLSPEKLRIVSRGEAPQPTATTPAPAPTQAPTTAAEAVGESCVSWAQLAPADAEALAAAIARTSPAARIERQETRLATSWWVFIPPQKLRADAERKAGELKALGIKDFFVVQDAGPNRWAISLGVFSSEPAASGALESLRQKGVRSARLGPRGAETPAVTLTLRAAANEMAALRALSTLPATECAASGAGR